jgi:hypothetical protein
MKPVAERFRVVPATAAATSREDLASQDRALAFGTEEGPAAGVVVCDGVGSLPGSGLTAEAATAAVRAFMADQADPVAAVAGSVAAAAAAVREDEAGATTMLVVVADPEGTVAYGMVGNGAIVEVLAVEPTPGHWRFHHTELAFPDIDYERGRPTLRSFLPSADPDRAVELGARRLRRDRHRLILACTDGLVTEDAPLVLRDERGGGLWRQVPSPLASVLDDIAAGWETLISDPTPELGLPLILQNSLTALAEAGRLDDDATLACLLLLAGEGTEQGR